MLKFTCAEKNQEIETQKNIVVYKYEKKYSKKRCLAPPGEHVTEKTKQYNSILRVINVTEKTKQYNSILRAMDNTTKSER